MEKQFEYRGYTIHVEVEGNTDLIGDKVFHTIRTECIELVKKEEYQTLDTYLESSVESEEKVMKEIIDRTLEKLIPIPVEERLIKLGFK